MTVSASHRAYQHALDTNIVIAPSTWGTPYQPHLPPFLTNNPLPHGYPWGGMTVNNTNPYTTTPNTGVTRYYDWTLTKEQAAPDGVPNTLLLVNGQYPGPLIEANWGDWVEVTLHNQLADEGAAIHWHGILQQGTPWMDGVPGYDQCPIAPGSTFTYRWQATLYGSSWWHSHYSSQYASGVVGPMVIHGPTSEDVTYDTDLGPIMVSDYYHEYYEPIVAGFFEQPPTITLSDNNLINGKNQYHGNGAPMASFNFTSGRKHRLRFINTSGFAVERVSLDGHTMTVIQNDFVPVVPYEVTSFTLSVGQRTDVIVEATGAPTDSFWLRAFKSPACSPSQPGSYFAQAAIFYENADRSKQPTTQPQPDAFDTYCGNEPLNVTIPLYPIAAAATPSVQEVIPIKLASNGSSDLWYMANRTFRANYNDPVLLEAKLGNLDFPEIRNVHNYGNNQTIRFIVENPGFQPHPMHLHGHNFLVLQEGVCEYDDGGINPPANVTAALSAGQQVNGTSSAPNIPIDVNGTATDVHNDGGSPSKRDASSRRRSVNYIDPVELQRRQASNSTGNATTNDPSSPLGRCWDGSIVRPENPQRRDVHMLLPGHYAVFEWYQDNPGVWPFHCHIAWHLSAGFVWTVLERPDDIQQNMQIPSIMAQTCRDWWTWSGNNVVAQIDDGI